MLRGCRAKIFADRDKHGSNEAIEDAESSLFEVVERFNFGGQMMKFLSNWSNEKSRIGLIEINSINDTGVDFDYKKEPTRIH
jgi:hypothetical protein